MTSESEIQRKPVSQFWVLASLVAMLCAGQLGREIDRPFYGMHSVDQAHNAWLARSHASYGFGYTRGLPTFAVGDPPAAAPSHYLDHPPLYSLLDAGAMKILGVNTRALRVTNLLATVVALLLFMKIVRALSNDATALLSGLVFALVPLITYFGVNQWLYPLCFLALWCYLVLVEEVDEEPGNLHFLGLAVLLFVSVQVIWQGAFFAAALGVHYLCRCAHRKQWPEPKLLAILIAAPLTGIVLNFAVLAAAEGWEFGRLGELIQWRVGSGERETHEWGPWFSRAGEFAVTNFTWVVLALAGAYLTLGQVISRASGSKGATLFRRDRRFPQFWLFAMPAIFQLFILKGVVWEHQWWERPLVPVVSIAAALGVLMISDLLESIKAGLASVGVAVMVAAIFISTLIGTNHYYSLRYYYPELIGLFESLQEEIPADKALLSFESYLFDQKPGVKQASYRPEVGWHLNREIVVARKIDEIEMQAATGRFPYYLMPVEHSKPEVSQYLGWLVQQLRARYSSQLIRASPDQWLFDLRQPIVQDGER